MDAGWTPRENNESPLDEHRITGTSHTPTGRAGLRIEDSIDVPEYFQGLERRRTFPRYVTQASSLLLDAFIKVRKTVDDMAQFLKEKEDEIKHKEFYVEEFNSTSCKPRGRSREGGSHCKN